MRLNSKNYYKRPIIYTIGTSRRSFDEFLILLKDYSIERAVDVRRFPTSRFSHFTKAFLQHNLPLEGILYHDLGKELGGFRKGGYAVHRKSDLYKRGIEQLEEMGRNKRTVFFCSERFPWKCHRRWIAEDLEGKKWKVIHIIDEQRVWIPKRPNYKNSDSPSSI